MKSRFLPLLLCGALAPLLLSPARAQKLTNAFGVKPAPSGPTNPAARPKSPPETKLAAKGAFPTVKAADAAVKSAKPAADLATAKKMVGKPATFVGTVASVFVPRSNAIVLINFAKDYKTAIVGAVKPADFAKFPDLKQLKGKKVLLSGQVVMFKGAPEIELAKVGAIKIVK